MVPHVTRRRRAVESNMIRTTLYCPKPRKLKNRSTLECNPEEDRCHDLPNVCTQKNKILNGCSSNSGCKKSTQNCKFARRKEKYVRHLFLPRRTCSTTFKNRCYRIPSRPFPAEKCSKYKDCYVVRKKSCSAESTSGRSSDESCNAEDLRRINANLILQNEALITCPYKKAYERDPEKGLDKLFFEERIKRLRQMLKILQEGRVKAEKDAKQLYVQYKKVETAEEIAQSKLRSSKAEKRKLTCKIKTLREELKFQIQTNNEEIKRLNDQILEAHKRHNEEEARQRVNIPLLLEKIRKEYDDLKDPLFPL